MSNNPEAVRTAEILLVEDESGLREMLLEELEEAGHQVVAVHSVAAAREYLTVDLELVISDLRLPGEDGLSLLADVQAMADSPTFIMITAFGTVDQAVEALKQGADDFLTKPLDLDHFRLAVNRALETRALRREVERYRQVLDSEKGFHGILGRSPAVQALIEKIRALAPADGPVLITGESGTGKELVARAIHAEGSRSDGPFIAVNCAGIPPELMESELFGHTAGAFTSANRARKGLIAEAHGGTLLLDEIGEMPMEMQTKLLRILQDGAIRQVGSNQEVHVDVRILAATNRNLDDEVAAGRFREDLFYRLETFALDVPALRERDDDIERMAVHFSQHFAAAQNKAIEGLDPQALARLRGYRFPGNVRELANAMERAVTFCNDRTIRPEHLPERISERAIPETDGGGRSPSPWGDDPEQLPSLATVQHRYIEHVLEVVSGNKRRASQILGIGRRTLYRRLEGEVSEDDDEDVP